jgi:hypothetical protein
VLAGRQLGGGVGAEAARSGSGWASRLERIKVTATTTPVTVTAVATLIERRRRR